MKKKFLLSFMIICIGIFALGIISASAEKYGDYLYYKESNCEITITDCNEAATEVEIPSVIDGKPVTSIGYEAFDDCSSLTSITIPDSVTSIGYHAFYNCSSLTSITIPDSVTSIGNSAFYYCNRLTSVYITDIAAYLNCDYGNYYSSPMSYANKLYLNGKRAINLTIPSTATQIPACAFRGCDSLKNITIPDSVTSIGYEAFYNCSSITSITIPDSVTSIGDWAFESCSSLTSIIIGNSVASIGSWAFGSCSSITSITIPDSVTSIGGWAFYNCSSLTDVYITDIAAWCNIDFSNGKSTPMSSADNLYINGVLVTDIVIPNSVTTVKSYAFYNCDNITSVTIGNSVTSIGNSAFYNCSKLETVVIPNSLVEIEAGAFANCNAIATVKYEGSDAEWAEMYIGDNNGTLTTAKVNYSYVLPLTVSYNSNGGGMNIPTVQKAEKNSGITISAITPIRDGYAFLGWATTADAKKAEYQPNDELTVATEDITLYAVWKRIVTVETEIVNNIFMVTPTGATEGSSIIFTCYKDKSPVYVDICTYQGSKTIPFVTALEYDEVKVMIWDSLSSMMPLCAAKKVETSEPINLLMIE